MSKCQRVLVALLTAVLAVSARVGPAGAVERLSGNYVTVPPGNIEGPLFVAGKSVVIDADVDGDVFAFGQTVTVNGKVNGDILAAARTILVNGAVTGSVRCLAQQISVRAKVGQSLTALAQSFEQLPGSTIARDVTALTRNTLLSGAVGRQVLGGGGSIVFNGPVGGDVQLWSVTRLALGPEADIAGNINYTSPNQALVDPGAKITGKLAWHPAAVGKTAAPHRRFNWWSVLFGFTAGAVAWGVLALLFPGLWGTLSQTIRRSPWPALGWGLVALAAVPPLGLLLLITVIGIPLSLTLLAAYMALLYAAKLVVGDLLGRLLATRFGWEKPFHRVGSFLAGYAALILLTKIPAAGFVINVAIACLALGAVCLAVYHRRRHPGLPPVGE